jgi:PAS domain S-box-containing protein
VSIANDAIISVDETLIVTDFNQGAEHIFGYPAREVLGRPLGLLLPERFRALHDQHVRNFADAKQQARRMGERQEIMGRRKDGTEFPAEASISKLHVAGHLIFTVVLRDITERRREERAQQFLAEAGALLASSLDYETTLASVARLAVSVLADLCVIFVQDADGTVHRLVMVHADPRRQSAGTAPALSLEARGMHRFAVLETGTSELVPQVTDAFLQAITRPSTSSRRSFTTGLLVVLLRRGPYLWRDGLLRVHQAATSARCQARGGPRAPGRPGRGQCRALPRGAGGRAGQG